MTQMNLIDRLDSELLKLHVNIATRFQNQTANAKALEAGSYALSAPFFAYSGQGLGDIELFTYGMAVLVGYNAIAAIKNYRHTSDFFLDKASSRGIDVAGYGLGLAALGIGIIEQFNPETGLSMKTASLGVGFIAFSAGEYFHRAKNRL